MAPNNAPEGGEQPFLVRFYDPRVGAKDGRGRTLNKILDWQDDKLEMRHDYIQILFPLPEGSPFNWQAPVIDRETFNAFHARPELRSSLQRSFTRLLKFYGFDVSLGEEIEIRRSSDYRYAFRNWVTRIDHNHLRITRIIRSLRVLGLEKEAQGFYKAIQDVDTDFPNRISPKSMMYWRRAATRALYLAPDEDDDDAVSGKKFLRDFEREKAAKSSATEETSAIAQPSALEGTPDIKEIPTKEVSAVEGTSEVEASLAYQDAPVKQSAAEAALAEVQDTETLETP